MNDPETKYLAVKGARLPYTMRGAGPLLLLISGGEGGGDGYEALARAMADQFTVVYYDRRGAPGTVMDNPEEDVRLETHSEDAYRLLAALTDEPAYIFGSSAGALVGLDLVIRHPEQVRTLVAHEPPVEGILPEFDRGQAEIFEALRQGNMQALVKLGAQINLRFDDLEPGVALPPRDPQDTALRGQALLRYTFPAVHRYRLNVEALAASLVRVVLAGGSSGRESPVVRCTQALAERLEKEIVEFPSHHAGYISYPKAFGKKLVEVLKGQGVKPSNHEPHEIHKN